MTLRTALFRSVVAALALAICFIAARAWAFTPPPLEGQVTDTAGRLSPDDREALETKLERIRRETGHEIVVFVAGDTGGEPIENVAYDTFNQWKVGQKKFDNGVLLVVVPSERRVRIETGKGVGGALTDLQS